MRDFKVANSTNQNQVFQSVYQTDLSKGCNTLHDFCTGFFVFNLKHLPFAMHLLETRNVFLSEFVVFRTTHPEVILSRFAYDRPTSFSSITIQKFGKCMMPIVF